MFLHMLLRARVCPKAILPGSETGENQGCGIWAAKQEAFTCKYDRYLEELTSNLVLQLFISRAYYYVGTVYS